MLIVEMNNLDVNSGFFYDVFTIEFISTSKHQDSFGDNKQIRLFLSKSYKKRTETRIFMNKKNIICFMQNNFAVSRRIFFRI